MASAPANNLPQASSHPPSPSNGSSRPISGAYMALGLLLAMNLFNYIDRQVLAAVEPEIRQSFFPQDPDGRAARTQSGSLASVFLVSYMLTAPLFGALAARWPRAKWKLIAVGVIIWSLATGAGGLAAGFMMLLMTRCFVGVGEGAYGPLAPTILSDCFPVAKRGKILSLFYVAMPVGGALGYALGGFISKLDPAVIHQRIEGFFGKGLGSFVTKLDPAHESWRWAFFVVVIPGLILGILRFSCASRRRVRRMPSRHASGWPGAITAFCFRRPRSCSIRWE